MKYDERIIENVKEASDIVDIIGRYVRLTKKGSRYFGLCPFHSEKTPSFSVEPQRQIFYCFGCGEGGDAIDFLMKYENYSFREALRSLAESAHIDIPEMVYSKKESGESSLKKKLLDANKDAAYFYVSRLYSPEGRTALEYFTSKRGLSPQAMKHFGLGYAPKSRDALYTFLKDKGYTDDVLKQSGLINYSGDIVRDRFFNRVMFPIMDANNRVRGFGGRVTGDGEPKYLNSPETPVFDKSELLYGLNFARKSRSKYLLLCEGYMDVIALQEAGFVNSVASLGTALNEKHARLLKRYTDNVILAQDSDEAGTRAKLRAYPILRNAGLNVRILVMEGAKDPDEFIKKYGASAYEELIKNARNAFLYMIEARKKEFDLADPAGKTDFYNMAAESLMMFEEPLERENYIDSVCREFMIDRDMLKALVDKKTGLSSYNRNKAGTLVREVLPEQARRGTVKKNTVPEYEKLIISWLFDRPELSKYIAGLIDPDYFTVPVYADIAEGFLKGEALTAGKYMDRYREDEESSSLLAAALAQSGRKSIDSYSNADLEKGMTEAVRSLKSAYIDRQIDEHKDDIALMGRLFKEKNELRKISINLNEEAF